MTRQKKEIMKKIEEAQIAIEVDRELGCGFAPANAYEETEKYIWGLYEELARLSHYDSVEAMFYDTRGCMPDPELAFA